MRSRMASTDLAAPLKPPREWFEMPEPDRATPLTVEPDGRVYGHLVAWDQCHTGFAGECMRASRSRTDYAHFHVGELETADGSHLPVGRLVYSGSHASLSSDAADASRHYDKTANVGAFVRARDGRHGIWLSGALRSDLTAEGLRDLKANPPSGDWRQIRGNLELVAALAVPVPGFPLPRPQLALAASGDVATLLMPGYGEEDEVEDVAEPRSKEYIRQRSLIASSLVAAPLSTKSRKALSRSSFAIPETRSYPIHDEAHARNALARASGKPEEGRVRRAVCRRYPNMGECAKK